MVEYELRDDGIAYLRLGEFSTPTLAQVHAALDEMLAQNPVGLVLDLRGNPGGLLRSAVDISSEFVPSGPILIERFKDGEEQTYDASGEGRAFDIPLVVLVNEGSASRVGDPGRRCAGHGPRRAHRNDDLWQGVGAGPASTERRCDAERHHGALVHAQRPADPRRRVGA